MTRRTLIRGMEPGRHPAGPRAVLIANGRIAALDEAAEADGGDARIVEASGLFLAPGFIELQVNGVGGHDFTNHPEAMWEVGPLLARHGVTAFLPTIITSPRGTVEAAIQAHGDGSPDGARGAVPIGLHVEGPFIAPVRCGAHPPELLRPIDLDEITRWVAGRAVRVITLAPELPGAVDAIAGIASAGVVASVGHTDADAATTTAAIDAGARMATHLFNAMAPLGHRAPGAAGALLADERVTLGLIVDGHHLDRTVVGIVARVAEGRVALVSDAIAALDLPDGEHRLGSQSIVVRGGTARLPNGTLAGSVAGLDACVRGFVVAGASIGAAIDAVTAVPARLLGLEDRGRLAVDTRADLVLLDPDLTVRATIVAGEPAHDPDARWA